ncbi:hypothetical protein [Flavobacterium sp. '19STA2R22 D10 B1']|uniref:hypothetical protein n=1 Tax=Flavobacterium aerium TaxID=3037261 RepID=UPI00278BD046|nr:hypothetical protein [Flavobacterium sp. '19STA2R22 D10 B1']
MSSEIKMINPVSEEKQECLLEMTSESVVFFIWIMSNPVPIALYNAKGVSI